MKEKLSGSWRKIPQEKRQLMLITGLTVLFHGLLLVLFSAETTPEAAEQNQLSKVGRMDLALAGNAPLATFIEVHDPALMTRPDRRHGYSSYMNDFPAHPVPEDLPTPPRLISPAEPAEKAQLPAVRFERSSVVPPAGDYRISRLQNVPPRQLDCPAEVWLNSRRQSDWEAVAQEFWPEKLQFQPGSEPVRTVLFAGPARLGGEVENIRILQSSGFAGLDQQAILTVHKYIVKNGRHPAGELVFVWRGKLPSAEKTEVKK